jgi:hypothetical protein
MSSRQRLIAAVATLSLATAGVAFAATQKITAAGAGKVKLGMTYQQLRSAGLVGRINHGCELSGPNARGARLRAPLSGAVNFTMQNPRKVTSIAIRGGATARGVGIGDTLADIKAAFPKAKVDHSTEEVFALTLVKVPKNGGGRLQFGIDTGTKKVSIIGIPFVAFCE